MGRGGRGGRSPTPNDDRSRSMNPQDPVGQAAMANTASQLRGNEDDYDDDYGDDGLHYEETSREEPEKLQEPEPEPTEERLISPTGETASIKWSSVDRRYILTLSDKDLVALFCVSYHQSGLQAGEIPSVVKVLELLGYEVEVKWRPL